jgi:tRNA1Val (adenine37-N6)-methyltransferase
MPNSWFRFKQFIIRQDRCAMKVCTDSCILGAWAVSRLKDTLKILDIGTGTGLLPLMLAQKSNGTMDAIESDPEAAAQARENIAESPWRDQIRIIENDVRLFSFEDKYDFIISNPPFYESDLRSPVTKKNKAKHDESLTLDQLLTIISLNLHPGGSFSILLPFHRTEYFEKSAAERGFFLGEKLTIRQTPVHDPFRSIVLMNNAKSQAQLPVTQHPGEISPNHLPARMQLNKKYPEPSSGELIIRDSHGRYTPEFSDLMQDYYG